MGQPHDPDPVRDIDFDHNAPFWSSSSQSRPHLLMLGFTPQGPAGRRSGWLVARGLGRTRWPLVLGAASLLLLSVPLQSGLRFGQVSVFLVVLAFADAAGLVPARWRGVAIGLAGAIKLTPLIFVPYLLVIGERRAALRHRGVRRGDRRGGGGVAA
ncbi:glycosyltransferase family 87 protein [Spirillospora sp. NPDC048911]|uniref:glycosyltransferase family 87 protein n=1 Tax=Spirillospora sp. NPDC048911 TaxID=3364527 RepID=UPI00371939C5